MRHSTEYPQPRYRGSWRLPLALVGVVATVAMLTVLFSMARATFDPMIRQQQRMELLRQQELAERLTWLDTLTAAGWRLLPLVLVSAAGVVGLVVVYRRWAVPAMIKADKVIALQHAQSQRFPAQLHSLSFHDSSKMLPPAQLSAPGALVNSLPADVPTFAGLLDAGAIGIDADGRKQLLNLGYSDAGAVTGDWRSLYSSGIGGLQGSGKTWAASYLLAQSALNQAKIVICDPHASDVESLASRVDALAPSFLCDIADDDRSIHEALRLADDMLQRRKHGDPDRTPCIVAVDEWSSLRRGKVAELLPALIEDFSTEGRKLNCHVMLLGQRWDKNSVGDFRNTLASSYVFRMRPDEARMMTGLRANVLPDDTLQLQPGECYLLDTRGQIVKVRIPQMTPADLARVGDLLCNGPSKLTSERGMGFQPPRRREVAMEVGSEVATKTTSTAPGSAETFDAEAARALALIQSGKGIAEVIKEMYAVSGGRLYQEKTVWLMEVIRRALMMRTA